MVKNKMMKTKATIPAIQVAMPTQPAKSDEMLFVVMGLSKFV